MGGDTVTSVASIQGSVCDVISVNNDLERIWKEAMLAFVSRD
jgi:hypothetical protein